MVSVSPARRIRLGLARSRLISTLPPLTASAASERVLKKRAAQSHLSSRIGSFESSSCILLSWPVEGGQGALSKELIVGPVNLERRHGDETFMHGNTVRARIVR